MDDTKKGFLRGCRGFIVFAVGTVMCWVLSGYAIYKGNPVADVVSVLYWWSTVAGMWITKMAAEKIGVSRKEP